MAKRKREANDMHLEEQQLIIPEDVNDDRPPPKKARSESKDCECQTLDCECQTLSQWLDELRGRLAVLCESKLLVAVDVHCTPLFTSTFGSHSNTVLGFITNLTENDDASLVSTPTCGPGDCRVVNGGAMALGVPYFSFQVAKPLFVSSPETLEQWRTTLVPLLEQQTTAFGDGSHLFRISASWQYGSFTAGTQFTQFNMSFRINSDACIRAIRNPQVFQNLMLLQCGLNRNLAGIVADYLAHEFLFPGVWNVVEESAALTSTASSSSISTNDGDVDMVVA